ncbi:MAG: DUF4412 domain-containing protein [Bacteroidetes bacterium]|nr:DUF4412 domain-containing protein [Bacteroidota bacterium]
MKKILFALSIMAMILSVQNVQSQDLEAILSQVATASKAVYDQEYNFDSYMQMEISDQGDHTIVYDAYLSKDGSNYAIMFTDKGTKSVILVDTKNNCMLMLSEDDGEKVGVAMGIDPALLAEMADEVGEADKAYADLKSGNTKTILGYSCDEYRVKEDGAEISLWISEKLGKEVAKEILANQQIFGGAFVHSAGMNGMVMEYIYKDDSSGENNTMKVTKIDLGAKNSIKVSDYAVMSIGQ